MVLGQRLSVSLFLFIGLIIGGINCAQAAYNDQGMFGSKNHRYFGYGAAPTKAMQDIEAANIIGTMIEHAEKKAWNHGRRLSDDEIAAMRAEKQQNINILLAEKQRICADLANPGLDRAVQHENRKALSEINSEIEKERMAFHSIGAHDNFDLETHRYTVEQMRKQRNRLIGADGHSAQIGNIVGRGIGGKTWDSFGFQQADGFVDGIQKGLMIRATEALGEAISSKLKTTIELVLGGTWDFMLLSGLDLWEDMCKVLFHGSKDPFKTKEINGWKKLISETMEHIEKNVKDGPKDSFRGHDMTLRSNFEIDEKEQGEATNNLNAWRMYIVGCAEQFDYFIFVLESRKQYYKKDDIICFYADQIQNRLSDYRALMLKAGSVKEFDEFIESNRSLLPAMRKNIEQLFTRLAEEVEPRTLGLGGSSDSMRRTDTSARVRPSGYDDDTHPNRFSGGWPS